ncbi:MAG: 3-isopropylmalate dehydratase large subunit [Bacteroidales bacterium]|nr:3-isopropylmalate dehydratase large subunit [Bacteroidales bacterium]HOY39092.1 aconitase/3-isopropylmalate dehydratase large subunit family protein [Bacteroidales bacterium]HQP04828.1 aconitase/3-isopropylmalate dehydratase large subunit family protein [Bacteroidales bacterium]
MAGKTFVEKVLEANTGAIVFRKPHIVLTHDNTESIKSTFNKMGGTKVHDPNQLLVVLDHNAPPTSAKLATSYQVIRNFVKEQGIKKFHDAGDGICHQLVANYAEPGMIIVGSDSHTCTAGAFNALAAGIDRTESAGLYLKGETWFLVPESIKITLKGKLQKGVYAKDISLWIIGMIGSDGANYMSIEYHGEGVKTLSISERMTLANLASEMGAKNAVFPADEVLEKHLGKKLNGVWADADAKYSKSIEIDLSKIFPLVAAPHNVDNVKAVSEVEGTQLNQGLIGTCTNGRLDDIRTAAEILDGKTVAAGFQLLVIPASKAIYLEAMKAGYVEKLMLAGANVLSSSCGPCLGTGQGIPGDGFKVISTANRNFLGRMGNEKSEIFLASPATVAWSAIHGKITDPRNIQAGDKFPYQSPQSATVSVDPSDNRRLGNVWNYKDTDNLNTDQMFAGNLTYNVLSSDAAAIMPHLFAGFDVNFAKNVQKGDIIICGDNFGCGSSREHPSVGLAHAEVKAVIVKSVNRIFYRSSINQGLALIVLPEVVDAYKPGDSVDVIFEKGLVLINGKEYHFEPLPDKLMGIIEKKGLVNWIKG